MGIFKKKTNDSLPNPEPTLSEKIGNNRLERGLPNLDNPKGQSNMGKVGLFLGILFATGLIAAGAIVMASSNDDHPAVSTSSEAEMVQNSQSHNFNQDKSDMAMADLELASTSEVQTASEPPTTPAAEMTHEQPAMASAPINPRLLGDVLMPVNGSDDVSSGNLNDTQQDNSPFMATTTPSSLTAADDNPTSAFANSLTPTQTAAVRAHKQGNRDFLLSKGTNILCTLDTQIITTRAGFTRCIITRDVYSANGKVLLLEKGSRIIGEQTSAMLQGQARVGILWNEVTTPKGVTVQLASPAAGQLGAAGVNARVDYHFWRRFGGAVMMSLINDLGNYASNRGNSNNGDRINFENSSEAAQEMATEALKNSINIPPTAYINHGTLINIMVARDVDFSGVYEVVKPYEMF